eukprot:scaffold21911_cov22-Prasinocladus_malaysianus.AAC.1
MIFSSNHYFTEVTMVRDTKLAASAHGDGGDYLFASLPNVSLPSPLKLKGANTRRTIENAYVV